MLALDVAFLLVAALDYSRERVPRVRLTRSVGNVLSLGRDNPVSVELWSSHTRPLRVDVNDDGFSLARVSGLPAGCELPAGQRVKLNYGLRPERRGRFTLGSLWCAYDTPLGLWRCTWEVPQATPVHVYPDVRLVQAWEVLARRDREQALIRVGRRRGGDSELDALRPYQEGDPYRHVDWRASARHNNLIVRQYKVEENQNLFFAFDGGRTMTAEHDGLSLFDHALNAGLLLAHVAVRHGDNVGAARLSQQLDGFMPLTRGRRALRRLVHTFLDVFPEPVDAHLDRAGDHLLHLVRRRSLIVLFTQVVDPRAAESLKALVTKASRRHVVLTVLLRDRELQALALDGAGDTERQRSHVRAAAAELLLEREQLARELRRAGAMVIEPLPSELTPRLLNSYLDIKAARLL